MIVCCGLTVTIVPIEYNGFRVFLQIICCGFQIRGFQIWRLLNIFGTAAGREDGHMTLKEARAQFFLKEHLAKLEELKAVIESGGDKDMALDDLKADTEELIRRFEQHTHGRHDRKIPIRADSLFSPDGELIRDDVLILRRMNETDYPTYHQLFMEQQINPQEDSIEIIFKSNLSDENLYCTILLAADAAPVGYCGIKYVDEEPAELAVELLKGFHRQGLGFRALRLYMDALAPVGVTSFTAMIDSDNIASQKLFEKLGFTLSGLTDYMLYTKPEQERFEEMFAKLISPRMEDLAHKLEVPPRKLLSHAVRYEYTS